MVSQSANWDGDLHELADKLRRWSVVLTHKAQASHVGTSLSMVELMAALYGKVLRVDPDRPDMTNRDRFVLSKGHGCAVYYAVLAEVGFFPREWLDTFYQDGSNLAGHTMHDKVPGIELSTGSLGHGLSVATGMALCGKRDDASWRVFCLMSDGECDEGSTWEPILFAPHHELDNLVAIVDYNKIQSLGSVKEVMNLEPLADKWRDFGWAVREIDGHDLDATLVALEQVPYESRKPSCIIAHTIKGKGISFMEDKLLWHYRSPQGNEYDAALRELDDEV